MRSNCAVYVDPLSLGFQRRLAQVDDAALSVERNGGLETETRDRDGWLEIDKGDETINVLIPTRERGQFRSVHEEEIEAWDLSVEGTDWRLNF